MLGIDETCAGSVRRFFKETGWRRSDPWTSIVDLDPSHPAGIIGLAGSAQVCVEGVAEGGTGRRPHARPEAALPSAEPAALTQYRNSSPQPPGAVSCLG